MEKKDPNPQLAKAGIFRRVEAVAKAGRPQAPLQASGCSNGLGPGNAPAAPVHVNTFLIQGFHECDEQWRKSGND